MRRTIRLRPQARDEIADALVWYDTADRALGERFITCLDLAMGQVSENPMRFPSAHGFQRAIVPSFPYNVYFRTYSNEVVIVAVLHGRRDTKRLSGRH